MRIHTLPIVLPLALAACTGPAVEHDTETQDELASPKIAGYAHPARGAKPLADGRLPYFDAKRSPAGKAYALGEGLGERDEAAGANKIFSGLLELDVRKMTSKERSEKPARVEPARSADRFDKTLRDLVGIGAIDPAVKFPVQIHLTRTREGTISQRINRAIAEGRIENQNQRREFREREIEELARELQPRISAAAELVSRLGGTVSYTCTYSPCLTAQMTIDQIKGLETAENIQRVGLLESSRPDALSGSEKAEVYQTRLFWDETFDDLGVTYQFDGNNGQSTDIRVAVLDDEGFRTTHVAFKEDSGSGTRIDGMWDCRSPPCDAVSSFSGIEAHGTAVLGTVLGDYRDGQDPAVATVAARESRSASGGEAKAYVYWSDRSQGDQQAVYDNIVNRSPAPHLLVSSNSVGSASDCSGEDSKAVGADGVYEAGIAYFKSANNFGGSSTNCNVGPPGEAIGVFTVAGFDDPGGTVCAMKSAPIHVNSGWGGSTSDYDEGKFRSIIALTGSYQGANVPWYSSDTAIGNFSGTSHATPSVAAAAINFIDMMKNKQNTNFIDDPGVLYAWMLNMGDRRDQFGGKKTSEFDHRTGAGNMKMRFLGNAGMDAPWYFYHYELCIDDGEVYTININDGAPISSDIESLRAVAWWYDRRIENGTQIDDVDLRLKTAAGTTLRSSIDSYDNKERVYHGAVGGQAIKLEVSGYDVTSDVEGCGSNSMRVFVTVMLEDSDRDDADGPDYDPLTCEGVETL